MFTAKFFMNRKVNPDYLNNSISPTKLTKNNVRKI